MFPPGGASRFAGKLMFRILRANGSQTQRRSVHPKRTEHFYVAPTLEMLAYSTPFIDGERQLEMSRVQSRFEADGTGAQNRQTWNFRFRHSDLFIRNLTGGNREINHESHE